MITGGQVIAVLQSMQRKGILVNANIVQISPASHRLTFDGIVVIFHETRRFTMSEKPYGHLVISLEDDKVGDYPVMSRWISDETVDDPLTFDVPRGPWADLIEKKLTAYYEDYLLKLEEREAQKRKAKETRRALEEKTIEFYTELLAQQVDEMKASRP